MTEALKSAIILHRLRDSFGMMADLHVIVDGERKTSIPYDSKTVVRLDSGKHEIYVKMDWCRSKPFITDLQQEDSLDLYCWSALAGRNIIVGLFSMLFFPRNFFFINRHPSGDITGPSEDKKRNARIMACMLISILTVPIFGLLHIGLILFQYFSGILLVSALLAFLTIYFTGVVWIIRFGWKRVKAYFEENPIC